MIAFLSVVSFTLSTASMGDKEYVDERRVSISVCDDGTKCCFGKEVKVFYLKKKSENSDVNLGKYNIYNIGKKLYEFFRDSPATIDYQDKIINA